MIRRATRFKPDPLDTALVQFSITTNFQAECCALIINESYTGLALVMITTEKIENDQGLTVQVGKMSPLKARAVWVKQLEPSIIKVGVEFVEPE